MNNRVSYEDQQAQGLVRTTSQYPYRYVSAQAPGSITFTDVDRGIVNSAVTAAGEMMTHRQMTHIVRSDDTALTQAQASLVYSAAYAFAAALITGGIVLIAWLKYGINGDGDNYVVLWLLLWGLSVLIALIINRAQGLHHSSTGIAHHEIESRERLAMYAIDRHVELIEKRWRLDR
jgi:hypothetical protein